ncbi:MAG: NmrA/HSCARG family protein [Acidobacteriota bacterium]
MSILVTGATGTVGSRVVRKLLEQRLQPRVLTRSPEKARRMFAGAEPVEGDLPALKAKPDLLAETEQLVLITPLSHTEEEEGTAALEGAHNAGVRHVVFMSVHQVELGAHIPHFRSKIQIAARARALGFELTEVKPNNFFQNDDWYKDAILQWGIYPQPIGGVGVSRVDAEDIAEAIVRALTIPDLRGERYPLVGPEALTGDAVADCYTRALGRRVRYAGDDLDTWAQQARQGLPDWLVADLVTMYRFFQIHGLAATEAEMQQQARILGREPRRFQDFVDAKVNEWLRPS